MARTYTGYDYRKIAKYFHLTAAGFLIKLLSNCYLEGGNISTKNVDKPVEEVDKFQKCNVKTSVLSVCIQNNHGM